MNTYLANWKTTLAGLAALLAIASKIATVGHVDFANDVPAAAAAVGLILAKDHNITGGTTAQ